MSTVRVVRPRAFAVMFPASLQFIYTRVFVAVHAFPVGLH